MAALRVILRELIERAEDAHAKQMMQADGASIRVEVEDSAAAAGQIDALISASKEKAPKVVQVCILQSACRHQSAQSAALLVPRSQTAFMKPAAAHENMGVWEHAPAHDSLLPFGIWPVRVAGPPQHTVLTD